MKKRGLLFIVVLCLLGGCTKTTTEKSQMKKEESVDIAHYIEKHPHSEFLSEDLFKMSTQEIVETTAAEYEMDPESYAVAYTNLKTKETFDYHENEVVSAASTIKVGIATLIIDGIQESKWDYTTEIYYDPYYYEEGAGDISEGPIEVYYDVKKLLEQMLVESDNTATNLLINFYEEQTGNNIRYALAEKVGITSFTEEEYAQNVATAHELELYLQLLLKEDKYQPIIKWMKQSKRGEVFKKYLKSGMATKHGINDYAHHDIGILFDKKGKPIYTLVILTDGSQAKSNEFMAVTNLRLAFKQKFQAAYEKNNVSSDEV